MTDGKQKIIAKPGERNKFDDAHFQVSEVMKLIKDAKVTRRMQEHYWREIFEDEEEENERDEEEEPEQDPNFEDSEGRFKNQNRNAEDQEEDNDDGDEEDGNDATEGAGSQVGGSSKDPKADRDEL